MLNKFLIFLSICLIAFLSGFGAKAVGTPPTDTIPPFLQGKFTDDYGIRYSIRQRVWKQHPGIRYHILQWNTQEQYLIAKNDGNNPSDGGLYTRIDYMRFEGMAPFEWGFCLTVYNATSEAEAISKAKADRQHPKTGCGGFPFSRMGRH